MAGGQDGFAIDLEDSEEENHTMTCVTMEEDIDEGEEDIFVTEMGEHGCGSVLKNRYLLISRVSRATHPSVFSGLILPSTEIIVKLGPPVVLNKLKHEMEVYKALEAHEGFHTLEEEFNIGFPTVLGFGLEKWENNVYIVLSKEGISLENLHEELGPDPETGMKRGFGVKELCQFAVQGLKLLQFLHQAGFVHRDIHPGNLCLNGKKLALLDFRAAGKYVKNGTDILKKSTTEIDRNGSTRSYCMGKRKNRNQSRKDDLESLGLMLIDLGQPILPWHQESIKWKSLSVVQKIKLMKNWRTKMSGSELCKKGRKLPKVFGELIDYARSLDFYHEPQYSVLTRNFIREGKKHSPQ